VKKKAWFVYIVKCRDTKLYTGMSNDVDKRVDKHNKGKGCKFTKYRYPVKLVYKKECGTRSTARKKELEIQGFTRSKKLDLINKEDNGLAPVERTPIMVYNTTRRCLMEHKRKRKSHSREFKLEAVRHSNELGKSIAEVARELDIRENDLHEWRH